MIIRWQKLLISLSLWIIAEICFNLVGMDELADYSEYVFERPAIVLCV
ncbi:MAG: hypothetical protein HC851_16595 [Acaryochloris sp. RU_4_1]|nr:hypothetical protein [Acaryochloris sp. SU_5_25]NJM67167.1 hypothetical protein [Acaryochloris sp. RU_4_1]NJN38149.1 hypothetical protein [Acaryochloridaceae cyanobacterium CSU_3_4]NJR56262.1 hypothetical protein [Acaryochloris sp. CRU_2_0]